MTDFKFCEEAISSQSQDFEKVALTPKYNVRNTFKDIFGVYLLQNLSFDGKYDMPCIGNFDDLSQIDYIALYSDLQDYNKTSNTCICFYQYDHVFDGVKGLYNSIIYQDEASLNKYKDRFKNVKYIIAPDYSLFGDFPNAVQIFNIYRSRLCACWLSANTKAKIIPNVRWTHPFTYEYCFDGIPEGSNIAIGFLGQIQDKENRDIFIQGFKAAINKIKPKSIIVYGFATENNFSRYFSYAKSKGIKLVFPHSKIDRYKKGDAIYGTR